MKRIQSIILLSIAIALILFTSCEEEASTTSLRVYLKDRVSSTRELYSPIGESLDIYGYIIEGSGPNDQSLSITSHSPQVEISGLMIGTWTLMVTGGESAGDTAGNRGGDLSAHHAGEHGGNTGRHPLWGRDAAVRSLLGSGSLHRNHAGDEFAGSGGD